MKAIIFSVTMLLLISGISYSSYHIGKADAQLVVIDDPAISPSLTVIDSLNSEIMMLQIDIGRMNILYERACEKLTQEEIKDIESNIE